MSSLVKALFVLVSVWNCVHVGPVCEAAKRPNVVLIMLDDVGYSDYGCFGSEIDTPNIDGLARHGLTFTQFYNNAVCVPTRASLMTGLYPRYLGQNHTISLNDRMVTLAEALRDNGYRTSLSGKWHLGRETPHHPLDRGFDEYYGLLDGCCNHHDPSIPDPKFEGGRLRVWSDGRQRVTKFPSDFYSSDAITDHALAHMRKFHATGQPFFVHICYTAAHSPLHAKPTDIAKYRGRYSRGWEDLRHARFGRQKELGIVDPNWPLSMGEPEFVSWQDEPRKQWKAGLMEVYAAMVDSLDQNIGRVLTTLRELAIDEDTLVIVLNDNGGCAEQAGGDNSTNIAGPREHYVSCGAGWAHVQNTPWRRYKAWCHEGGITTPLIIRWPRVIAPGRTTNYVGHLIDLMPTLLEATQSPYPRARNGQPTLPLEGQSLVSVLNGQAVSNTFRNIMWAWLDNRAMRSGDWKIVWDQDRRAWELYDFQNDRVESKDLAGEQPARVAQMSAQWYDWARMTGAVHRLGQKVKLTP